MRLAGRIARVRARMAELGVDVLLLSAGPELPYLTGYEAMPLERLTMLVLPRTGDTRLGIPRLEVPRITPRPELFEIVAWQYVEFAYDRTVRPPVETITRSWDEVLIEAIERRKEGKTAQERRRRA